MQEREKIKFSVSGHRKKLLDRDKWYTTRTYDKERLENAKKNGMDIVWIDEDGREEHLYRARLVDYFFVEFEKDRDRVALRVSVTTEQTNFIETRATVFKETYAVAEGYPYLMGFDKFIEDLEGIYGKKTYKKVFMVLHFEPEDYAGIESK